MFFLGLMSAGAGHGDYFLAKILFPYTLLSTAAFDRIEPPFMFLLIQYPVYGVVIGSQTFGENYFSQAQY